MIENIALAVVCFLAGFLIVGGWRTATNQHEAIIQMNRDEINKRRREDEFKNAEMEFYKAVTKLIYRELDRG